MIYPNPNTGVFTIQSNTEAVYSIVNDLGQTIMTFKLNAGNNYTVNIENIASGIYFIYGINDAQVVRQKVIVNK